MPVSDQTSLIWSEEWGGGETRNNLDMRLPQNEWRKEYDSLCAASSHRAINIRWYSHVEQQSKITDLKKKPDIPFTI